MLPSCSQASHSIGLTPDRYKRSQTRHLAEQSTTRNMFVCCADYSVTVMTENRPKDFVSIRARARAPTDLPDHPHDHQSRSDLCTIDRAQREPDNSAQSLNDFLPRCSTLQRFCNEIFMTIELIGHVVKIVTPKDNLSLGAFASTSCG